MTYNDKTVAALVSACIDLQKAQKLTSHPLKFKFAEENKLDGLDAVHEWMIASHRNFDAALSDVLTEQQE